MHFCGNLWHDAAFWGLAVLWWGTQVLPAVLLWLIQPALQSAALERLKRRERSETNSK